MGKESTSNAGDMGSTPGLERSPGRGNGNPLQYSCLENPMDRGAWPATVHGVAKSDTTEQLHSLCFKAGGLPRWLSGKKQSAVNAGDTGDTGLIPGLERSPGRGIGNPLWYSCLENSMDRGACWAIVHGVTTNQTQHSD